MLQNFLPVGDDHFEKNIKTKIVSQQRSLDGRCQKLTNEIGFAVATSSKANRTQYLNQKREKSYKLPGETVSTLMGIYLYSLIPYFVNGLCDQIQFSRCITITSIHFEVQCEHIHRQMIVNGIHSNENAQIMCIMRWYCV